MDSLSLFGPADFREDTPLEAVSPNATQFDPEAEIKDIIPAVRGNLDQLGTNDPGTLSADPAPNPLINAREMTQGMDPQRTARVIGLSRSSGLPPRVVEQHMDELERRQLISDEKLDQIQNQAPKTAALLSDQNFFAVAQNDIDRLAALEGTISQYRPGFWERLGTKWEESVQQLDDGIRGFALGALSSYVRGGEWEEQTFGMQPVGPAKFLRELAREALAHVQAKHDIETERRGARLLPAEGMAQQYLEDFVGASAPILATIGLGAVGGPAAGAAFMGTQIAGGDYLSRKEQGAGDIEAFTSGLADAALQAPLEAFSLGRFFNIFKATGGAQILKNVAVAMGSEFTTEFLQKFPEDLTEDLALADVRGQDVWEAAGTFLDGLDDTAKAGLYEGLLSLPWAIFGGAGQVVRDYSNLRASEQEQAILDTLTQDLSQTNLAQLDPVLYQEAVRVLGQGSAIENIYIPAPAFAALYGQDLAAQSEVLTSLGISSEAYQSAVSTGDELVVPLGNYAATIAAVPDFAAKIASDRKLSKDGYTRNEWVEAQQALMETYQNTVRLADEETQARTQEEAETKAIYEDALALRQQAGRVQDAARSDALQLATFMTNLAKRSEGKYTPTELWGAYKPKVTASQAQVEQQALQQGSSRFSEDNRLSNLNPDGPSWDRIRAANPALRGKSPEDTITVYRATIGDRIRPDDFVAVDKATLRMELRNVRARDGKGAKVIEQRVRVRDLLMGNDATEFIYFPEVVQSNAESQAPTAIDPFDTTGDWATQELELEEGIAPAGEVISTLKARAAELQKLVECLK